MVNCQIMRVLLLNLNSETNDLVNGALAGQGYDITIESGLTVDEVLALSPEVLVTEASPTDLSCCGMITQLKARSDTRTSVKILMVVRGGALERARALDLGADDVITFPFEAIEFAARVRTQFRERQPEEDLKTMLKYAVQREQMADIGDFCGECGGHSGGRVYRVFNGAQPQGNAATPVGDCAAEQRAGFARSTFATHGAGAQFAGCEREN